MDEISTTPGAGPDPSVDDLGEDQDSEPMMNAPESERPDGLDALDHGESTGGDGTPS